jgi:uncharacterized Tic20 family protein
MLSGQPLIINGLLFLLERQQSGRDLNVFFIFLFFLPLIWFILLTILSGVVWLLLAVHWRIKRSKNQLIDSLNKEFINFVLSSLLILLGIDAIIAIGYYLKGGDATYPYIIGIFLNLIVLLWTFSIIVYAIIQFTQRRLYRYPCVVRVFSQG